MHLGGNRPGEGHFDLTDPTMFAGDRFIDALSYLREHEPVHFQTEENGPGFWIVTRHADVSHVYANADLFSSRLGMRLGANPDAVKAVADRMLIVTDNPEHTYVRRLVGSAFTPPVVRTLETHVKTVVRELMDRAIADAPREFVSSVARPLPTHIICSFMGLPRSDWERIGQLTTDGIDSDDDDVRLTANSELFLYFTEAIEERRQNPGQDLITILIRAAAEAEASGAPQLGDVDLVVNLAGILIGANETTRYAVAGGLVALAKDRNQWMRLQQDQELVTPAVEEILRWTSPAVHAMRTVTQETRLGERTLAPGDRVTLWTYAANRDPSVFTEPDRFDITRHPNRHLSFGNGRHICVGARLARMEIAAFLEELRTRVQQIRLVEPVKWSPSNFTRGPLSVMAQLDPIGSPTAHQKGGNSNNDCDARR
ncbi:cytochrome P450 [Salinispora pacifica]|uniref:cytochrome P450 n=1 Tax=Salinispora pacifica TaxID=351187 RepID=UPI0004B70A4F|nr:cytochrome P450 [Salinispora pacifica]